MAAMFRRMVVAGVGLIGGSLALAARRHDLVDEVVGYGRARENLRLAQKRKIIDWYFLRANAIPKGTDLLVLATPVQTTTSVAESFLPQLEAGCLVSDVGSVKGTIVREMERLLPPEIPFVGAHPIAGSEKWGAVAAVPDLFLGHRCILTPGRDTDPRALKRVATLWRRVGAKVEVMNANLHDRILGVVSHLPHVLAYALVNTLSHTKVDSVDLIDYCGGGFKDFTRIASSRPEIWRDICLANRHVLDQSLGGYIRSLQRLRRFVRDGEGHLLEREFARANEVRREIS